MDAKFRRKSSIRNAPAAERIGDGDPGLSGQTAVLADRACCCAAKAAVLVTMPPSASRKHSTQLLLCGHHYRVSRQALATAGAVVRELPGTAPDVSAWTAAGD